MRIAITGADGQLGTDIADALGGHDLVRYVEPDRRSGGYRGLDVTERRSVAIAIAADNPRWVINTAAMTDVDGCEGAVAPAVNVNAVGARNVAEACAAHGATLIHISTDYVFDGARDDGYSETDSPHPINVYGMTKLMGEWYVAGGCKRHYILRSSGLYGSTPAVGKGGANFVETMLRLARERDSLRVVSDEVLTPTYTVDLARQLRTIIEKEPPFGIYHATNGGRCSWFDFAGEIFRAAGVTVDLRPISSREWNAPAKRPANSVLNNDALTTHGCDVMPDWRDALARYLRQRAARK
jgi:dTDP-4-dehydrorhamnose reductase